MEKNDITPKEQEKLTREKAAKERAEKLRKQREADTFKRKYFEYYDDIKHSYREDW